MALTELVSNLAAGLYGAPTPSQFVMPIGPGSSNTPTDAVTFATTNNGSLFYIQNSGNGISRRIAQGFNNLGYLAFFGNKQSKDFFPLFTALGESGTSRRMNQGGYGFPFPSSPITGDSFDWKPESHTGWNINNRYNDTTNKTSTIGLADTYTIKASGGGNIFSTFKFPLGGIFGTATLQNQGGIGFPFPIGPTGNVYDWKPNAHTGWSDANKYNDNIGAIYGNSGLADTYTTNSPIDDIYNKVKVRSAAWNKNSFGLATDQPFILRGIQRDNNSDPQYWGGFADTITDTPRGGIATAAEREAVDKARIGKFLISPKGIFFAAKQLGLQASNPNVEGPTGTPSYNPIFNTKLWNPLSLFSLNTPVPYHITRHGIPGDPTGLSAYSYEKMILARRARQFANDPLVENRLVRLKGEAFSGLGVTGLPYKTLGGSTSIPKYIGGPKSFLGLGFTNQRRYTNTSLSQLNLFDKNFDIGVAFVTAPLSDIDGKKAITGASGMAYDMARYKFDDPYIGTRDGGNSTGYIPGTDVGDSDWSKKGNAKLLKIVENETSKADKANAPFPNRSFVLSKNANGGAKESDVDPKFANYHVAAYGKLDRNADDLESFNDYRKSFFDTIPPELKSYITDPTLSQVDYNTNNIVTKYSMPDYGKRTTNTDPTKSATGMTDHHLDITNIDTKDLIQFTLQSPEFGSDKHSNALKLKFRAYISSISDSWSVQTTNMNSYFLNQALTTLGFDSTSRNISIDMTIPILAKADLVNAGNNLDLLARTMYGKGSSGKRRLPAMLLRIGNYTGTTVVLTSLSYDIDNETPWDIDNQTPMVVQVSMQFTEQDNAYTDGIRHGRLSKTNTLVYF